MCHPTAYDVVYEINTWMSIKNVPDKALAAQQWEQLHAVVSSLPGVQVHLVEQAPDCPDMVFTANAGLVRDNTCVLSRFRFEERQREVPHFFEWFRHNGYRVIVPSEECIFEGEGDALFMGDTIFAGYRQRSEICSHLFLAETFGKQVLSLELVDPRWYHLDTCLFPLAEETVVYYPGAFDQYAQKVIENHAKTITVGLNEALLFCCNSLVGGKEVVMNAGCDEIAAKLAGLGYRVHPVPTSEFIKAGGSVKCLCLRV